MKFTFLDREYSKTTSGGLNQNIKYKWLAISTSLAVNDTEADINLRVTIVKLTGQNEEDIEIAWGTVPLDRIEYAYENEGIMPKSFPIELNNAKGVDGKINI